MKTYTMKEFNASRSRICREAEVGEVVLTKHGKPWLRLARAEVATLDEEVATFEADGGEKVATSSKEDILSKLRGDISRIEGGESKLFEVPEVEWREVPSDLCADHQTYRTTYKMLEGRLGPEKASALWGRCLPEEHGITPVDVVSRVSSFGFSGSFPKPVKKR